MSDKEETKGKFGYGWRQTSSEALENLSSVDRIFDESLLKKDLERIKNNSRSSKVLELEQVYTGPNMRKERDQFRAKASSYKLFKYF